jgi:hypothetical protein
MFDLSNSTTGESVVERTDAAKIHEVHANDSIESAKDSHGADLFIKTGMTGNRRFLVSVENAGAKPTLIALHL